MAFEGNSQLKMSDETFDFWCTACADNNMAAEAVKYCVECCGYCCQSCTDAHKKVPVLVKHDLMDVSQGKQASGQPSSLVEFPTERCSIHKGKVVDMYCEGHDVVGCYVCIAKDHKSCKDSHIHSIPDMIDTIFKLSDCKQTYSLLKDTMVSMETVSKSKNIQLHTIKKAKKEALCQVSTFQKALETILSKLAESSRKEIEVAYKQLETEIIHTKQSFDSICKDLQMSDDKLDQSEENRAQRFVCTKIAQAKIKEADGEKMKHVLQHNTDVEISFIPDQSLMEYIQALQGIGQVQKHNPYNIQALHGIGQVQKNDPCNIQGLQGIGQVKKHNPCNIQALQGIGQVQKHNPCNIQALQGIGQVQKHNPCNIQALQGIGQVPNYRKQKHDLYKIKGSRNITIRLSHDSKICASIGCCLTHDNQLLVTDCTNKKLKRIDIQKMSVVDYCTLDSIPFGVCCISKYEVAVTCRDDNKIQFVSIHNKMIPTRQIEMSHPCYDIAFKDGQIYVTDWSGVSLYVHDATGNLLKTITRDNAGNQLFNYSTHVTFNGSGDRMFVGDGNKGLVCFDGMGNYLSNITDTDLKVADGVCVDGRGNMFVVGFWSHNVVQFSENGKKLGVVLKQGDGLRHPRSVCFHQGMNRMFVTMGDSDVVKMYELE